MCEVTRLRLFFMLFGVVSGVWGPTPPALFVLPLFEQISVLYDACMCVRVVCTTLYPGRAGQAPFLFYGS